MWFARWRRRRRHGRAVAMHAELRRAEAEQRAGVTHDPEHQAWVAELRAKAADMRASPRRGNYPG
jgi:hypothetical protein